MQADLDPPNLNKANLHEPNLDQANLDQKDFHHFAEQHGGMTTGILKLTKAMAGAILLPLLFLCIQDDLVLHLTRALVAAAQPPFFFLPLLLFLYHMPYACPCSIEVNYVFTL